jgi:hypothetical protein
MTNFEEAVEHSCGNCAYLCPNFTCGLKIRGRIKNTEIYMRGKYCPEWVFDDPNKEKLESVYQACFPYDELKEKIKNDFILDKKVIELVCIKGEISLSDLMREAKPLESLLGETITIDQLFKICDRYAGIKLIKKL